MNRTLLLMPLMLLSACQDPLPATTEPAAPRAVRVAEVVSGPAAPPVRASGLLTTRDEAALAFKVGGVIREITVREGDTVTAGQRLAALETAEIDAAVAQAREAHRKAARDLQRGRRLHAEDVIPQEALDDLATAEAVAAAALRAAEYNRSYAVINASADGRVLRRLAEPRQLVAAGAPVIIVSDRNSGQVMELGLPDRDVVKIRPNQPATLRFDALPSETFEGRVVGIGQAADPRSGTFRVEVALITEDPRLASGMIGHAHIAVTAEDAQRPRVPLSALVEGTGEAMLLFRFDAETGTVRALQSAVAFMDGDSAVLAEPLAAGTQVVTDGAAFLRDGERVRIIE